MTQVHISNRLLRDFGMVPNALWSAPLPLAAKAVAAYLLSLRDGAAVPYVAEIEATLGIGRDSRRRAFEALEAAGFLSWVYVRDERGVIRRKVLALDPFAFDALADGKGASAALAEGKGAARAAADGEGAAHAPESQAHGCEGASGNHAPDNPAGGFPTPAPVGSRRSRGGESGGHTKTIEEKKARAALARAAAARARQDARPVGSGPAKAVAALTAFERSLLSRGESFVKDGRFIAPGTAEFVGLASALAASSAGP